MASNSNIETENTQEIRVIEKGLLYTKEDYEDMVIDLWNRMHEPGFKTLDRFDIQYVYGMYYNAFVGLLRSGVWCSRRTGTDGLPELTIPIGAELYPCRESIVAAILGEEAPEIIVPYDDTFSSYMGVHDLTPKAEAESGVKTNSRRASKNAGKDGAAKELALMEEQLKAALRDGDELRHELHEVKKEARKRTESASSQKSQLQIQYNNLKQEEMAAKNELEKTQAMHKEALMKLTTAAQEKHEAADRITELELDLKDAREKIEALSKDNDPDGIIHSLYQKIEALKADGRDLNRKIRQQAQEISSHEEAASQIAAQSAVQVVNVNDEEYRREMENAQEKIRDLTTRYDSLRESTAEQLQQKDDELKEAQMTAKKALSILNRKKNTGKGKLMANLSLAVASLVGFISAIQYFVR